MDDPLAPNELFVEDAEIYLRPCDHRVILGFLSDLGSIKNNYILLGNLVGEYAIQYASYGYQELPRWYHFKGIENFSKIELTRTEFNRAKKIAETRILEENVEGNCFSEEFTETIFFFIERYCNIGDPYSKRVLRATTELNNRNGKEEM